jgi:hypothetical protein
MALRLVTVCALALCLAVHAQSDDRTMPRTHIDDSTLYPRLIRLEHGPAEIKGHLLASTNGIIFRSIDDGRSFQRVTRVPTIEGSKERCCATLWEMPVDVGSLKAGTLLSSASYFEGKEAAIQIYTSTDEGQTWNYLATPVKRGGAPKRGLWEPEFIIAKDGALVMFWSDETDPCCSQKLTQIRTTDGTTWRDERDTVRSTQHPVRPGMIVVSKLRDNRFFMSYEVCGPGYQCIVYQRISRDGWSWGKPEDMGRKAVSKTGQYFAHAPTNHILPDGRLILIGQVLFEANGDKSMQNGSVLFISKRPFPRQWDRMPAPVAVPDAFDHPCPNYASVVLPTSDGKHIMELATDFTPDRKCTTFEGIAALPQK